MNHVNRRILAKAIKNYALYRTSVYQTSTSQNARRNSLQDPSRLSAEGYTRIFGDWSAIYRRFNLWSKKGIMIHLFNALKKSPDLEWKWWRTMGMTVNQHENLFVKRVRYR